MSTCRTCSQIMLLPTFCAQGKLRIGLAEQTVIVALAHAALLHRDGADGAELAARLEQSTQAVKMAYSQCPSWDELLPALLTHGPAVRPPQ